MEKGGNGLMKLRSDSIVVMSITYGLVVLFCIFSVLHLSSVSKINLSSSIWTSSTSFRRYSDQTHQKQKPVIRWVPQATTSAHIQSTISCDRTHYHYDICTINGSTVLDPTTSTFYISGPTRPTYHLAKIRPYPRKFEISTMSKIKEVTLVSVPSIPICDIVHNTSAVVFTAGGYTGNFFHDFNEGFLPLFVTVESRLLSDRDVTLVVGKSREWWVRKYGDVLRGFSLHPIVNLDNETNVHCFRSVTVGLISHGFMSINPHLLPNKTIVDFHNFLNRVYSKVDYPISRDPTKRPKLVLLSRTGNVGRVIINQAEITTMAEQLGFDVTNFEPKPNTSMREAFGLMIESHVLVGVHGAALTHLLFLRPGSVFIQVVPIGTDEVAELCYGKPAKEMGLDYKEYKIGIKESSLVDKYNKYDPILTDPNSLKGKEWSLLKKVYLKEQDVELDLIRFRKYLKMAYRKAKRFMKKVGNNGESM